jgi:glycine cleavage system aminomethyltransferase T
MATTVTEQRSATLYFGPWYRRSPMFEATRRAGCDAYDVYNHMYLPAHYDDPLVEYAALTTGVTLWDVGVERTVEVSGPDADVLVNLVTCRDLTTCAVGQGKYVIVTAPDGGIVNDPVLLHVAPNRWWLQLADSDAHLYLMGVLVNSGLDAEVTLPDVHPVQVQGPRSVDTLRKLVGDAIAELRYYWCAEFRIKDIPVVISRTGWTAIPGFEVNLLDGTRGSELWDAIMDAGAEFAIRPISPSEARRVEAGIFNYGSDITLADTPLHVMGLERLVEEQHADYIGKAALQELQQTGVDRKLVGISFGGDAGDLTLAQPWPVHRDGRTVGRVTDVTWSPALERYIGYVWVPIELASPGHVLDVESEQGTVQGTTAAIPFIDPHKRAPAAPLAS